MPLPNFMIAGVEKAGTTSVYNYLNQHPEVYMSPIKEPNFLERDWDQYYAEGGERREKRIDTLEKYSALFEGANNETAIGEASPNCLFHHEKSIPRIQEYIPNAQIFVILRNPAERAYSDYLMHIRDCINPGQVASLSEQIKNSAQKSFTIRKGFYHASIKHFKESFGEDNFKVLIYDDLKESNVQFMKNFYEMIGVNADFVPNTEQRFQTAQVPKNQAVNKLLRTKNPVRNTISSCLKLMMPEKTRQNLRNTLIGLNSSSKATAPFSQQTRSDLIEIYKQDILNLQDLIQRDLSAWLV